MPFCNVAPSEVSLMRRKIKEHEANDVVIVDHAILVTENMMKRYAEKRSTACGVTCSGGSTTSSFVSWFDAVAADVAVTVRPYPYPSLFLYPLPPGIDEYSCAPLPSLLAPPPTTTATETTAQAPHDQCAGEKQRRGYRSMFAVDGRASEVVTVQQGECGLAVVSPCSRAARPHSVYLMSPDATSCTIVACRVGLHPRLRQELMTVIEKGAATGDEVLVWRSCETFTAAIGHFDSTQGLVQVLHEMLWEVALPAWFHAVLCASDGADAGVDVVRAAADLLARLRRVAQSTATVFDAVDAPAFRVEWFVVGGIHSQEHTLPVLGALFGAFFAEEEGEEEGGSGCRSRRRGRHILRPSFRLSDVLSGNGNEEEAAALVRLEHYLREDGVCFWSFNTELRQWALGREGGWYSCATCWGLLLDVGGGCCWPAMVQPGSRNYPLVALRQLLRRSDYRWTCPLEREGALRVWRGPATARATSLLGLEATLSTAEAFDVSLSTYVALFLQRVGSGAVAVGERLSISPPLLVRHGTWERLEKNVDLDGLPDNFFLTLSTTPHCEPPDFVRMGRQQFTLMAELDAKDVFVEGTLGMLL